MVPHHGLHICSPDLCNKVDDQQTNTEEIYTKIYSQIPVQGCPQLPIQIIIIIHKHVEDTMLIGKKL